MKKRTFHIVATLSEAIQYHVHRADCPEIKPHVDFYTVDAETPTAAIGWLLRDYPQRRDERPTYRVMKCAKTVALGGDL